MRALSRLLCCLAVVMLCAALPEQSVADKGKGGGGSGRGQGSAKALSADQAAERVRKQTGGRVLRIDDVGNGYRVKVLTPAGEVREIAVPTGQR